MTEIVMHIKAFPLVGDLRLNAENSIYFKKESVMAKFFPPGTCFRQISTLMNVIQLGCLNSLVQSVSKCFENENHVMHQEKACLVWLHPFYF